MNTIRNLSALCHLYSAWDVLSDIPTDEADCIEEAFLHFPVGTCRETIWHWFESRNSGFVVGKVMEGQRVFDTRTIAILEAHGYLAGERDPEVNPLFSGRFMIADRIDPDGFKIVGDDLNKLLCEALDHVFACYN